MKTPLLKRRLNPFLLASTVLVLSILAGLSVMFQGTLDDELDEKKSINNTLQDKKERISQLEAKNANLSDEIRSVKNDIDEYTSENERLKDNISILQNNINDLETDVDNLESNLSDINDTLQLICVNEDNNLTSTDQDRCNDWGHPYEGG